MRRLNLKTNFQKVGVKMNENKRVLRLEHHDLDYILNVLGLPYEALWEKEYSETRALILKLMIFSRINRDELRLYNRHVGYEDVYEEIDKGLHIIEKARSCDSSRYCINDRAGMLKNIEVINEPTQS